MDHPSLYARSFAVNDSDAAETRLMRLMQVLLDNPFYVARWNSVKIEDVYNRDLYRGGERIKWINIQVIDIFSTLLNRPRGRQRLDPSSYCVYKFHSRMHQNRLSNIFGFLSRFSNKQPIHEFTNQKHELTRNVVSITSCDFISCDFVD